MRKIPRIRTYKAVIFAKTSQGMNVPHRHPEVEFQRRKNSRVTASAGWEESCPGVVLDMASTLLLDHSFIYSFIHLQ